MADPEAVPLHTRLNVADAGTLIITVALLELPFMNVPSPKDEKDPLLTCKFAFPTAVFQTIFQLTRRLIVALPEFVKTPVVEL